MNNILGFIEALSVYGELTNAKRADKKICIYTTQTDINIFFVKIFYFIRKINVFLKFSHTYNCKSITGDFDDRLIVRLGLLYGI